MRQTLENLNKTHLLLLIIPMEWVGLLNIEKITKHGDKVTFRKH